MKNKDASAIIQHEREYPYDKDVTRVVRGFVLAMLCIAIALTVAGIVAERLAPAHPAVPIANK